MKLSKWVWLVVVLCAWPASGWAEGSGGQGAPLGARDNWPCQGCNVVTPPGYSHDNPTPLLVTFHGDEGDPEYIQWRMEDDTMSSGYLMLNLMCPRDLGCGQYEGSWWRWEAYSNQHDSDWVDRQVDAVEAAYNVELQRVYLAGFSGGASYLSEYPWRKSMRYAGLVYLGGGYSPRGHGYECDDSACRIPAYFLIGSRDFLLDGAQNLRDYLTGCGHEVEFDQYPGLDHQIVLDGLPDVFDWMEDRPHLCRQPPDPVEPELGDPLGGCTQAPDCGTCEGCMAYCLCETGDQAGCDQSCTPGGDTNDDADPAPGPNDTPGGDWSEDNPQFADEPTPTQPSSTTSCSIPSPTTPSSPAWLLLALVFCGRRR